VKRCDIQVQAREIQLAAVLSAARPAGEIGSWLVRACGALASGVSDHGGTPEGDAWEVYLSGPSDPATWRTEIVQPYARSERLLATPPWGPSGGA
jgi:hypothetical protein